MKSTVFRRLRRLQVSKRIPVNFTIKLRRPKFIVAQPAMLLNDKQTNHLGYFTLVTLQYVNAFYTWHRIKAFLQLIAQAYFLCELSFYQ